VNSIVRARKIVNGQPKTKTTMGLATEDESDDGAGLLDEFFSEIENLTINDENNEGTDDFCRNSEINERLTNNENPSFGVGSLQDSFSDRSRSQNKIKTPKQEKHQQQKRTIIDRADEKRNTWKEFTIAQSSSSPSSSESSTSRKPLSFSLNPCKKKTKKPSSTRTDNFSRRQEISSAVSLAFGDDSESPAQFIPFQYHLPPRWVAVLDTCALLESFESVCGIFHLVKQAQAESSAETKAQICVEELTIVIPNTVWDELDYRSKEIQDEHQKYKARRAARMLTLELVKLQKQQHLPREEHRSIADNHGHKSDILRTQSRNESHRATNDFLFPGPSSSCGSINNDDRILACALYEQKQFLASSSPSLQSSTSKRNPGIATVTAFGTITAGGVVLITSDKVLSGKSRAENLWTYTPAEFVSYYNQRMTSLRSRTTEI